MSISMICKKKQVIGGYIYQVVYLRILLGRSFPDKKKSGGEEEEDGENRQI